MNHRNNHQGDAKSVLSLVGTDTLLNDNCSLIFEGHDSEHACQSLESFIHNEFPHCDEALATKDNAEAFPLPQSLMRHQPALLHGKRLATGIGHGKLIEFSYTNLNLFATEHCDNGHARFHNAHQQVINSLSETVITAIQQEKDIITAHLAILNDSSFTGSISDLLREHSTANAILATFEKPVYWFR
ncbi:phosphoenolpyruvate-utilizing N-terminal domain-containing protein [Photobacterium gaetbulicola]|uniref:phosphoenolpyruvate-utilizing N-terminal domain-containing protein n=1 Tax=Photobacterium gaetbulicola TaxID=1295392 RepID=UPI00068BACA6|nr:phosphoenolpyruvate-utilizing N-terminal domain-containing protein [Photobacterium gaetbulicola]